MSSRRYPRPHRSVRGDRRPMPFRTPREHLRLSAAGPDPHDRRARVDRPSDPGRNVACRANRKVNGPVGTTATVTELLVFALQFGTATSGSPPAMVPLIIAAPGIVVGADIVALGDVHARTGERHPVRGRDLGQRRLLRRRTFRHGLTICPAGTDTSNAPSGSMRPGRASESSPIPTCSPRRASAPLGRGSNGPGPDRRHGHMCPAIIAGGGRCRRCRRRRRGSFRS